MLSFIKKLFSKNENSGKNLISTLKKDHQKLFEIYTNINDAMQKEDFETAQNEVKKFVSEYNKHILLEDTQLYVALQEKYKEKKTILRTIKEIEKDMNAITRAIKFLERKYPKIDHNNKDIFMEELTHIGNVLTQRVELEEERLYPLL